jgi:hypothetical protein
LVQGPSNSLTTRGTWTALDLHAVDFRATGSLEVLP